MIVAEIPQNENKRLETLLSYNLLDTSFDVNFTEIVELASTICQTPIGLVSIIDKDKQWSRARIGNVVGQAERDYAFCSHAILQDNLMEVEDASKDIRFFDNPYVNIDLGIKFYAGFPLQAPNGSNIGTLCVLDNKPRKLDEYQKLALEILSRYIVNLLELSRKGENLKNAYEEINFQKNELADKNATIKESIDYARVIQTSMMAEIETITQTLPGSFIYSRPLDVVSGDIYYFFQQDEYVFFSIIDCTGHGVPGALLSIMAMNFLSQIIEYEGIELPGEILNKLNKLVRIALKQKNNTNRDGMDISLAWINTQTREVAFAGAKNALHIFEGNQYKEIAAEKYSIGDYAYGDVKFESRFIQLNEPSIIYMFSDGYYHQLGGLEGKKMQKTKLLALLKEIHSHPADEQIKSIDTFHKAWKGNEDQTDDIMLAGIRI